MDNETYREHLNKFQGELNFFLTWIFVIFLYRMKLCQSFTCPVLTDLDESYLQTFPFDTILKKLEELVGNFTQKTKVVNVGISCEVKYRDDNDK